MSKKLLRNVILFVILFMFITFVIITYKYITSPSQTSSSQATTEPTTSAPTTSAPTTSAPTTSAPTTSAPTTSAPTTLMTRSPTTSVPTTLMTRSPTTSTPTTSSPTTISPTLSPIVSMITPTFEPVGYFYHIKYNSNENNKFNTNENDKDWTSKAYGIVKGVIDDLKSGWWSKQWKMLPLWADDKDTENIVTRIFYNVNNDEYYFSHPERNDPSQGCRWITNTYMSGVGDQFMLKRVYQDQNRNWLTYDGNLIVKSDGTIIQSV